MRKEEKAYEILMDAFQHRREVLMERNFPKNIPAELRLPNEERLKKLKELSDILFT